MATRKTESWSDQEGRAGSNGEHLGTMETTSPKEPKKPKAAAPREGIVLPQLDIRTVQVTVVGDTELICHRFSAKARRIMLGEQEGKPSAGREKKVPLNDFLDTLYTLEQGEVAGNVDERDDDNHPCVHIKGGRFGFPTIAFKNASVEACTSMGKAITKVAARQCFHVLGDLAEIKGQPRMREDMVRLNGSKADIRHRAGFPHWECTLRIRYNARVLTAEQLLSILNLAGFAVGVGDWRAERGGTFGAFSCK